MGVIGVKSDGDWTVIQEGTGGERMDFFRRLKGCVVLGMGMDAVYEGDGSCIVSDGCDTGQYAVAWEEAAIGDQ